MSTPGSNSGVAVEVVFPQQPFGGVQVFKTDEVPLQIQISSGIPGPTGPQGPPGPVGETGPAGAGGDGTSGAVSAGGITQLLTQSYVDIDFETEQDSTDWILLGCHVVNTVDPTPLNIWPGIITDRTTTGFQLQLSGIVDSDNYFLHWSIGGEAAEISVIDGRVTLSGDPRFTLSGDRRIVTGVLSGSTRFTLSGDTRVTDTGDTRVII